MCKISRRWSTETGVMDEIFAIFEYKNFIWICYIAQSPWFQKLILCSLMISIYWFVTAMISLWYEHTSQITGLLWGICRRSMDSLHKGPIARRWVIVVSVNRLWTKQLRWCDTPWCSHDVTVMWFDAIAHIRRRRFDYKRNVIPVFNLVNIVISMRV